jgi:hypothetical protein
MKGGMTGDMKGRRPTGRRSGGETYRGTGGRQGNPSSLRE